MIIKRALPEPLRLTQAYLEDILGQLTKQVYWELSINIARQVTPSSSECFRASALITKKLKDLAGFDAQFIQNRRPGSQHGFILLKYAEQFWLVDPTYQQFFVSALRRRYQPPVIVFPIQSSEDIGKMTRLYGINQAYNNCWDCAEFKKSLQLPEVPKN